MKTPAHKPRLLDLITDPTTGRLSHTRVWSNIGSAAAVVLFVAPNWLGRQDADVWAMFLAGICGHAAISKFLSLKYASKPAPKGDE